MPLAQLGAAFDMQIGGWQFESCFRRRFCRLVFLGRLVLNSSMCRSKDVASWRVPQNRQPPLWRTECTNVKSVFSSRFRVFSSCLRFSAFTRVSASSLSHYRSFVPSFRPIITNQFVTSREPPALQRRLRMNRDDLGDLPSCVACFLTSAILSSISTASIST